MKKILLIALSLLFTVLLHATSLEVFFNGVPVQPGATVTVIGDPQDEYIQARLNVKNISSTSLDVKVKKVIHEGDTLFYTSNYFCWGLCFPPFTYVSPNSLTIAPGEVNEEFYGDYNPNGVAGISRVTYVFFDMNNVNDSVAVVVEYNGSPASVIDLSKDVKFSEAYPNPASSVVNVDYKLSGNISSASIMITNMLGKRVKEIELFDESGKIRIPVFDLGNGVYFYSLVANGQVIQTRKFVIRH